MSQEPAHAPDPTVQLNEDETALLDMFADFLRERARARMDDGCEVTRGCEDTSVGQNAHSNSEAQIHAARRESAQLQPSHLNMLNMLLESPSGYPTGSISHALARPPFRVPSSSLSRREVEVLQLIEEGLTNREIAQHIVVEQGTVKRHVHNILSKLNARNRTEAVAKARNPVTL